MRVTFSVGVHRTHTYASNEERRNVNAALIKVKIEWMVRAGKEAALGGSARVRRKAAINFGRKN